LGILCHLQAFGWLLGQVMWHTLPLVGVVILGCSSLSAAVLVVVTASDMALPGVAIIVGMGAELVVGGG